MKDTSFRNVHRLHTNDPWRNSLHCFLHTGPHGHRAHATTLASAVQAHPSNTIDRDLFQGDVAAIGFQEGAKVSQRFLHTLRVVEQFLW